MLFSYDYKVILFKLWNYLNINFSTSVIRKTATNCIYCYCQLSFLSFHSHHNYFYQLGTLRPQEQRCKLIPEDGYLNNFIVYTFKYVSAA